MKKKHIYGTQIKRANNRREIYGLFAKLKNIIDNQRKKRKRGNERLK